MTISTLVEFTGLSRSTFAKGHIRELLVEHGYDVSGNITVASECKKTNQSIVISEKDKVIAKLKAKNTELERECELLRGRLFLVMQKLCEVYLNRI